MSVKFGPFDSARIRFGELYNDALDYLSATYKTANQYFSMASPLGQLLQVTMHLGRMIMYYIEDSITELNILTATRPNSVKGLAVLTGHNPSRVIASRGVVRLSLKKDVPDKKEVIIIPNNTKLININNNLTYTLLSPSAEVRLDANGDTNGVTVSIIQGYFETQQVTGTGEPLQSFNIQSKKSTNIDNFIVNVYVDGEMWKKCDSLLDMQFMEESLMVKTGQTGGIDIFFGNEYNGKIPRSGSIINIEYLICEGEYGNITKKSSIDDTAWKFTTNGFTLNSESVDLNMYIGVDIENDIVLGAASEPLYLTRLLAPQTSRSYVLANAENYNYFLSKLNMFSVIDAFPGYETFNDKYTYENYNNAKNNYSSIHDNYIRNVTLYGEDSASTLEVKKELDDAYDIMMYWNNKHEEEKKDDNTVYLFLVPDITKRITTNESYFTCDIDKFKLTNDEKTAILDYIEESGQRVLTVDNVIIDPLYVKFCINMSLILWEGTDVETVNNLIYSKLGEYFSTNSRRDIIPVSDLVRIIENIDGVDSVNVWFDADVNNELVYGNGENGIDQYGDIILGRTDYDYKGNVITVNDIYPLFRGDFVNSNDVYYEDSLDKNKMSNINISVRGYTKKDFNALNTKRMVNEIKS